MEGILIQTTQNVDINYELASVGDRLLAALLDYVFFIAYLLLAGVIIQLSNYHPEGLLFYVLLYLPLIFYDLIMELAFNGRSFGKMIMKIKVVKIDGTQPGLGAYLLRWMLRLIDSVLFLGSVALIAIIASDKGQRLGDMAAGTTVVKLGQKLRIHDTILNKLEANYTIRFPEVNRLSDQDIAIIKEVMRVSLRTNNTDAIQRLADKTKATMNITSTLPNVEFLATVVQDYSQSNFEP